MRNHSATRQADKYSAWGRDKTLGGNRPKIHKPVKFQTEVLDVTKQKKYSSFRSETESKDLEYLAEGKWNLKWTLFVT